MTTFQKFLLAGVCSVGVGGGIGAGMAFAERQPHMEAALGFLGHAKEELVAAAPDKGGYRVKAIADVDQSIADVRAGIAAANAR